MRFLRFLQRVNPKNHRLYLINAIVEIDQNILINLLYFFRLENLVESSETQWVYQTEPAPENEFEPELSSNFEVW